MDRRLGGTAAGRTCLRKHQHCVNDKDGPASLRTFRRLRGILVRKRDFKLEETSLPQRLVLARHSTLPLLQIEDSLLGADRFGEEAEGVIFAPLFPARLQG